MLGEVSWGLSSLSHLSPSLCTNWSRESKDTTFPVESGHQELPSTEAAMNMHLHPFGLTQKLPTGSPVHRTTPLPGYWTTINQGRTGLGRSTTQPPCPSERNSEGYSFSEGQCDWGQVHTVISSALKPWRDISFLLSRSHVHIVSVLPGMFSQLNHLHSSSCLKVCFKGTLKRRHNQSFCIRGKSNL